MKYSSFFIGYLNGASIASRPVARSVWGWWSYTWHSWDAECREVWKNMQFIALRHETEEGLQRDRFNAVGSFFWNMNLKSLMYPLRKWLLSLLQALEAGREINDSFSGSPLPAITKIFALLESRANSAELSSHVGPRPGCLCFSFPLADKVLYVRPSNQKLFELSADHTCSKPFFFNVMTCKLVSFIVLHLGFERAETVPQSARREVVQ